MSRSSRRSMAIAPATWRNWPRPRKWVRRTRLLEFRCNVARNTKTQRHKEIQQRGVRPLVAEFLCAFVSLCFLANRGNPVMKLRIAILVACLSLAAGVPLLAHHSFAAEFDASKAIRVTGTLTRVQWTNPHTYFYIDVKDENGN